MERKLALYHCIKVKAVGMSVIAIGRMSLLSIPGKVYGRILTERLMGLAMSVYERCGMSECGNGVGCDVVEWVKRSTLRWFGHIERMGNEFVKRVYFE